MPMSDGYRNAIANLGATLISHIGLVDDKGVELAGGKPAYARQPVNWLAAADGTIRPSADLIFNVAPSAVVAGWRGYTALTGGTDYGGETLTTERFVGQGEYKLLAAGTGIKHRAA